MKRLLILVLLLGLLVPVVVLPAVAQEATATEEADAVEYDPEACFAPAANNDGTVQYEAKEGPYVIGVSNSFIGNAWRTQMIQMAQAFAET